MCDTAPIRHAIVITMASLVAAMVTLASAFAFNSNFITSWYTPIVLGVGLILLGVLGMSLLNLLNQVNRFYTCLTTTPPPMAPECNGAFNAFRFAIAATIAGTLAVAGYVGAIIPASWVPGVAIPTLVKVMVVLIGLHTVMTVSLPYFFSAFLGCLSQSSLGVRVIPIVQGSIRYKVATCKLNRAGCKDSEMGIAGIRPGTFFTSRTFAVIVTNNGAATISSIAAEIRTPNKNVVIDRKDILPPQQHKIVDPAFWAVRFRWDYLEKEGVTIEASRASRTWRVQISVTLSDNTTETVHATVIVSS